MKVFYVTKYKPTHSFISENCIIYYEDENKKYVPLLIYKKNFMGKIIKSIIFKDPKKMAKKSMNYIKKFYKRISNFKEEKYLKLEGNNLNAVMSKSNIVSLVFPQFNIKLTLGKYDIILIDPKQFCENINSAEFYIWN